jgi:hypothetical protein
MGGTLEDSPVDDGMSPAAVAELELQLEAMKADEQKLRLIKEERKKEQDQLKLEEEQIIEKMDLIIKEGKMLPPKVKELLEISRRNRRMEDELLAAHAEAEAIHDTYRSIRRRREESVSATGEVQQKLVDMMHKRSKFETDVIAARQRAAEAQRMAVEAKEAEELRKEEMKKLRKEKELAAEILANWGNVHR